MYMIVLPNLHHLTRRNPNMCEKAEKYHNRRRFEKKSVFSAICGFVALNTWLCSLEYVENMQNMRFDAVIVEWWYFSTRIRLF
jgi:hypothetical protein